MIANSSRTVLYALCSAARLNARRRPFFEAAFDVAEGRKLLDGLRECERGNDRSWFTATMTTDDLTRIRVMRGSTAHYEKHAADAYARGDSFRVSGGKKSMNVDFSSIGAGLLANALERALARADTLLVIRIPSRNRHLLEFIPDVDLPIELADDADKLARAGELLAGSVLEPEDFSDWEN